MLNSHFKAKTGYVKQIYRVDLFTSVSLFLIVASFTSFKFSLRLNSDIELIIM